MRRRDILKAAAVTSLGKGLRADVPTHLWSGYDFGPGPRVTGRLNQGPFGIEQDEGWFTLAATTPSERPAANFGLGLVGYTWEEGGASLAVRAGRETIEQHVEKMASLPFVDVLYIRCDWRDVQKSPGRLDLSPVWKLTLDAAKRHGRRVAFRVMLSNTVGQPKYLADAPNGDDEMPLLKGDADDQIMDQLRIALTADRGDGTPRWGILEASRRISAVRSASLARTQAMRALPTPPRDAEKRSSKRILATITLDDLLREELQ